KRLTALFTDGGGSDACGVILEHLESGFVDAIAYSIPLDVPPDQSGVFQLFEMLGNSRLGEGQFIDDVAADAGVYPHQVFDDRYSCGVAEGFGNASDAVLLIGKMVCFGGAHKYLFNIAILR